MSLLKEMQKRNTIVNSKGSEYYRTSYDSNLDVFAMLTRFNNEEYVINTFQKALVENHDLALANLLYLLDIRGGKGERRLFKIIYAFLCNNYPEDALKILPFIGSLGRYDYLLVGLDTKLEKETINYIKKQLAEDNKSDNPSLLAKWLPSHRTHNKNNILAQKLMKALGFTEKEYRHMLANLRSKINIVEKNLTTKEYDNIDFAKVPCKAMMKYAGAFNCHLKDRYESYKEEVALGKKKINTTGLFAYEVIQKVLFEHDMDNQLYDLLWANQKEIFPGNKNLLVVADTSGSMLAYNALPYCTSVGLAIYVAQKNEGFFHNHFITFSEKPTLQEIKGKSISQIVHNMEEINAWNTDIDKVFALILDIAKENNLSQSDLPEQILIISDMEFDRGIHSKSGTNFVGWKKAFAQYGYSLPTIVFWNASGNTHGLPTTKFENDVAMVSGFSTNVLTNLLTLDKYSPTLVMLDKLQKYLDILKEEKVLGKS